MSAADNPDLVRLMARAGYDSGRFPGCKRPAFDDCMPQWQAQASAEMAAAIRAAEAAGYRIEGP